MLNIIFCVFVVVVILQLVYYLGVFGKFSFAKPQIITPKRLSVSVIVCAKNDAEKVKELIPVLLAQNYPDFELVLIDNASSDETLDIFEEYEKQYRNIRLVKVENNEAFWGNKKYALTLGIKAASKDYLLFTDADCYPTSPDWILNMTSQFTLNKTIVLGYSAYEKQAKSFLNKIIRYDAVLRATQQFAWAKLGRPFTGNGRNLAYKKDEFFKRNGYINHMNILTGEDALFINDAAGKKNTAMCYSVESFTYTKAKKTFKSWTKERRKAAFTASFFKPFDRFQLKLFTVLQAAFFILMILLLALQFNWMFIVPVIAVRYVAGWITMAKSAVKLNEKDIVYWYPVMEIILIFTQLYVYAANLTSKPVHWK
jgi:glycosyltransferase involved in cell wall biosynthesis